MRYRFADVALDIEKRELTRAGAAVELQPKVFDLLRFLIENRARLVTRQELLDAVWDGTIVGDAAISRAIKEVRRAVGDDGEAQRIIKTMHGRGFRFVGELVEYDSAVPLEPAPNTDDFIGREASLRQLEAMLSEAGAGRAVLVTGEAGIGKSVLIERFARTAAARGFEVHHARCSEADGVPALWPWEQLVRSIVAGQGESPTVPSELGPLLGAEAAGDDAHARFRLHDGCVRFLADISRVRPLLLIIDDLHLADEASLALLQSLLPRIRPQRIALVAAARAASVPGTTPLSLDGFDATEVSAFFERQTGVAPASATVDALREWTGGNPLFLSHLVHLTEGEGSRSARLPRALRDAVEQTIEVLGEDARAALSMASVVGTEFRLVVVAKAMGKSPGDLLDAIGEALEHRILRRVAQRVDTFTFAHGVLRDALYAQLSLGERARRHALVGDALANVYGASKDDRAEELAHHYLRGAPAQRADQAVEYATRAGDHAVARAAYEHAVTLYRAALDALPLATDQSPKARVLVRLGSALGRDGRLGEAGPMFREAAAAGDLRSDDSAPFVRDVPALRSSFEAIVKRAPELTTLFYDRLFAEHPDLKALFRRNPPVMQAKMMNDTLLAIIDRLEDAPWLRASLAALGARHVAYGVTDAMYPRVGASLLATLADAAGPDIWTPHVAEAWAQAFGAITTMMLDGARQRSSAA